MAEPGGHDPLGRGSLRFRARAAAVGLGHRLGRAPRGEDPATVKDMVRDLQPRFREAVFADAEVTARYRGERHDFRSRADALVQVLRLAWVTEAFFALVCYRAEVACRLRRIPILPGVLHRFSVTTGQVSIGPLAVVAPGLYLPHGQVVVDGVTSIGHSVVLRPFVTIGLKEGNIFGPCLGPYTKVGTGAKLFGPISVGEGASIGANAVVNRDVPHRATAVGVPARVVGEDDRPGRTVLGG